MASRQRTVLNAIGQSISNAINGAGITTPSQTSVGWPVAEELTSILAQSQYLVSLNPPKTQKITTRIFPHRRGHISPTTTTTIAISGSTLTFSGFASPNTNIYVFLGVEGYPTIVDVPYSTTTGGISGGAIAAAIQNSTNSLGISGLSASTSGGSVLFSGVNHLQATVGSTAIINTEIARIEMRLQIGIWSYDPNTRDAVRDAVLANVGCVDIPKIPLGDGTSVWVRYVDHDDDDESQGNYSLYYCTIVYACQYAMLRAARNYKVAAYGGNSTVNGLSPVPFVGG